MAKYLLLLRGDTVDLRTLGDTQKKELFERFVTWTEEIKSRKELLAVESLMDDGGKIVRRKHDTVVVDGPYAEMKEMVSGLFVVEMKDMDAAVALAADCPLVAIGGSVEVREIAPFPVTP